MDNWEGLIQVLSRLLIETSLGPGSSLKVESVDVDSLAWSLDVLLNSSVITLDGLLQWLVPLLDSIKRPAALTVLSGDLLESTGQETLLVIETSEPEARWSSLPQPVVKLEPSIVEALHPSSECWSDP